MQENKLVELTIGNLKKYIEGNPEEARLSMPQSNQEIIDTLRAIGVNDSNQEVYLSEIELPDSLSYLENVVNEHSDPRRLNLVLQLIQRENPNAEIMGNFIQEHPNLSLQEIGNLTLQVRDIPYHNYQFDEAENFEYMSPQEKYGYTLNEQSGIYGQLKELGLTEYMDFEACGREKALSGNLALGDKGWYDRTQIGIQLDKYTEKELYKIAGIEENMLKKAEHVIKEVCLKL